MADPEALAEALGTRFRNGDLEGILVLSHPEMRDGFRKAFQGEPERMTRAADLLATRKKVNFESGSLVEFEVRDGERAFPLTFERLGGTWVLRSM
jgi:hypothetical protein